MTPVDFNSALIQALPLAEGFLAKKARQAGIQSADIADLKAETAVKALKAAPRFDMSRPVIPWLKTIALHALRDHLDKLKRKAARRTVSLDAADGEGNRLYEQADRSHGDDVPATLSRRDRGDEVEPAEDPRVRALLAKMKQPNRRVVELMLAGMGNTEIAEITGVPTGTVGTVIHRFRKAAGKAMA